MMMTSRTKLPVWQQLQQHAAQMQTGHIKQLFHQDPQRAEKFSLQLPHMLFDYSKNLIAPQTMALLLELANQVDVAGWRNKMFAGEEINITEQRSVLHVALRDKNPSPLLVDGVDVRQQVRQALSHMEQFVSRVRQGQWLGYSGKRITDVVSIGIGGSNLGPQMVTEALSQYADDCVNVHYVSNVDGTQIEQVLSQLQPQNVLFVVSSKTFTTSETMTNANTAMRWLVDAAGDPAAIAKHFVAVSANLAKVAEFGIAAENIFPMWDWVGGRYSLWSTIGLPIALSLGFERFVELLEGAQQMDQHFVDAELAHNAPVILALLSVWNCTFLGRKSQAILPYDQPLHRFAAYMQQAEMESNGKSVSWNGESLDYPTVASIWGEVGINGQHAFYQYLHQSNNIVPADFIGFAKGASELEPHQSILMANMLAQAQALMDGVTAEQVAQQLAASGCSAQQIAQLTPHKVHQGNRPSNTLLLRQLDAKSLGYLIAMYEHKIFVQGIILQICSFDQWGVELGKGLANSIVQQLNSAAESVQYDSSTNQLINFYQQAKDQTKG